MGGGVGGELGDLRYAGWLGRGMVSIGMPGSGDERVGCASERMTIICMVSFAKNFRPADGRNFDFDRQVQVTGARVAFRTAGSSYAW